MTIDNLDGLGAVDYSGALWAGAPLRVERVLNAPSLCFGSVALDGRGLAVPVRRGRVVVSDAQGNALFTGYLAKEPVAVYAGIGTAGPVYRYAVEAVSDEWLLDRLAVPSGGAGLGVGGGQVLRTLTTRVGGRLVSTAGVSAGRAVGVFQPVASEAWSVNAGALAGARMGLTGW